MRLPHLVSLALALLVAGTTPGRAAAVTITVEQELTHGGNNYDDPCFLQYPVNPSHSLACITRKNDAVVECFTMPSGDFAGFATGSRGVANTCDVDAARDELVTTANSGDRILVHPLPDLGGPVRVLDDPSFADITGVCVGHRGGQSLVFTTDEARLKVFVLNSVIGRRITSFSHGLSTAAGVACAHG